MEELLSINLLSIELQPLSYSVLYLMVSIVVIFAILRRPFRKIRRETKGVSIERNFVECSNSTPSICEEQDAKLEALLKTVSIAKEYLMDTHLEHSATAIKTVEEDYYDKIVNLYLELRAVGLSNDAKENLAVFFYDYALAIKSHALHKQELYKARDAMRFGLFIIDQTSPHCNKYMKLIDDISKAIRSNNI